MSKYYTPEIEEINIKPGDKVLMFYGSEPEEVEVREITHDMRGYDPFTFLDTENLICRVSDIVIKYLDQEDIESLGFEFIAYCETTGWKDWVNGNYSLEYDADAKKYYIHFCGSSKVTLFYGKIKNKSELKRLLKQIGYDK